MYANIIVPLAISSMLTYHIPLELEESIGVGDMVSVPVANGIYRGVVASIDPGEREGEYKDIISIDIRALVSRNQLKMWHWVSSYYLASAGEVMRAFLPSTLRTKEVDHNLGNTIEVVSMPYSTEEALHELLDTLKRSKRQQDAIGQIIENGEIKDGVISIDLPFLIKRGVKRAAIKDLASKSILEISLCYNPSLYHQRAKEPTIDSPLKEATDNIITLCKQSKPVVVDGHNRWGAMLPLSLAEAMAEGHDSATILLLLPNGRDVRLYDELFRECSSLYVVRYYGAMAPPQRSRNYMELLTEGGRRIIIATRVAIGLPLDNLVGVIVMQEHSSQYKISEPAPSYNGRDGAVMLGHLHGAKVVLYDSTPSMESMYNVAEGKYSHYGLGAAPSCKVTTIDRDSIARKERRESGVDSNTRYISQYLNKRVEEVLSSGGRVLIYHARRGFSQYILCSDCGDVPRCPFCNVSLTYHKERGSLECHYCGYHKAIELSCGECGGVMKLKGVGTENIEEKVKLAFPAARVVRVDSDSKSDYGDIAAADIVVGTQLINRHTLGSEFALTVLLNSDTLFSLPDFRATERAMQIVSALKDSTHESGELIVQGTLDNTPYAMMIRGEYSSIYPSQITERGIFAYPPITRMVVVHIRDRRKERAEAAAAILYEKLHKSLASRVSPVDTPYIEFSTGLYRRQIVIKIERDLQLPKVKSHISEMIIHTLLYPEAKGVKIFVDVDPY